MEVRAGYIPIAIDTEISINITKQLLAAILPHVYLTQYLRNSVTAPTFFLISPKEVNKLAGGPTRAGGGKFFKKN